MTSKVATLKSQLASAQSAVKALPQPGPSDAIGKTVRAGLDKAVATYGQNVSALDSFVSGAKVSFDEAVKTGKVANAQKVIDDTKARFDQLSNDVAAAAAGTNTFLGQYRRHLDDLADRDFTDLDFKPGTAKFLFDRPASKATLQKLVAYMNRCPELVVDLVGHTSNEGSDKKNVALSTERAKAVRAYLVSKEGVDAAKFRGITGVGDQQNVVPEPTPGSAEAKAMGAKALDEARRKNRRITVHPVTPCWT
jgi:outer membrane protein OmpA-like peptidoglycan-associated protein